MKEGLTVIDSIKISSDFSSLVDVESLVDHTCSSLGIKEDGKWSSEIEELLETY